MGSLVNTSDAMGKKGKKGGGKKGRKSKKDGLNPREAFINVRIKMRRKHIAEAAAELESLTAETGRMGEQVDKEDIEKNFMIKTVLDNLHWTDRDLENTMVDAVDAGKLKQEELTYRQARRRMELSVRENLNDELRHNNRLEVEVQRWLDYRSTDHVEDDTTIAKLEALIGRHDANIDEMKSFILKQIETAKNDADKMLTALNAKHRENAFIEAMKNSTPGALYEFRESEKLEKWVNEQTKFVEHESAVIDRLQKENLRLINELERLKLDAFDTNAKEKPVLSNSCFDKIQPIKLPSIPKIELGRTDPPLMSRKSYETLMGEDA